MIEAFINLAFAVGLSTAYGYGEENCGDYGLPRPCSKGAVTASGEVFDPDLPTAAIFAPRSLKMRAVDVHMQVENGPCIRIRVNDKGNQRYIGKRGFDLSPAALEALTGDRSPRKVTVKQCQLEGDTK